MAQIEPVSVWKDGQVKTAEQFSLRSIGDDLESSAQFYYELKEAEVADADGNVSGGSVLAVGNLGMSGQDYIDWGSQSGSDINQWAYEWAADKLNVVLV